LQVYSGKTPLNATDEIIAPYGEKTHFPEENLTN
jgi:hypothetical protein